jgi:hypothetical protein
MKRLLIILNMVLLMACSHKKNDTVLAEAASVHEEAMQIFHDLEDLLKTLEQNDAIPAEALETIKSDLHEWEEGLVEVPGYEHNHDYADHRHHHHHKTPELSSEEMLQLQKEFRNSITTLLEQVKTLLQE